MMSKGALNLGGDGLHVLTLCSENGPRHVVVVDPVLDGPNEKIEADCCEAGLCSPASASPLRAEVATLFRYETVVYEEPAQLFLASSASNYHHQSRAPPRT